jgi:hypothetical protein
MQNEIITLPHGYTAEIAVDEYPENPFAAWDCQPPIAVLAFGYGLKRVENYDGHALDLPTLLDLIPEEKWESREGKREIRDALPFELAGLWAEMIETRSFRGAIENLVASLSPSGWGEWVEYFDAMQNLAAVAGIPCHLMESCGHSQGESALVFVAALPAWVKETGTEPEHQNAACDAAAGLWGAWAWGDVYGVARILSPDGEEVEGGDCWGFYGFNHEESGLLDHCRDVVRCHRRELVQERAEAHAAACRDIFTIPAFA